jgi:hypothetical protein
MILPRDFVSSGVLTKQFSGGGVEPHFAVTADCYDANIPSRANFELAMV